MPVAVALNYDTRAVYFLRASRRTEIHRHLCPFWYWFSSQKLDSRFSDLNVRGGNTQLSLWGLDTDRLKNTGCVEFTSAHSCQLELNISLSLVNAGSKLPSNSHFDL